MKIAILGTKGIPNNYGGFEQFAEYLSIRLVARGHQVTVYNPSFHPYHQAEFQGVNIRTIFSPEKWMGGAANFLYDHLCLKDALRQDFDIVYEAGYHSVAYSYKLLGVKEIKRPVILTNMDGLEWKRSKWSPWVQKLIRKLEAIAVRESPHLISDNQGIRKYYLEEFKRDSFFVPYGADPVITFREQDLDSYQVKPRDYFLLIARMEPENNVEMVLQNYIESNCVTPFVVVGGVTNGFGQEMVRRFSQRVKFVGPIYDKDVLDSLRFFSKAYFHGHSVGGTNPSLLEAMSTRSFVIAHDNPFNRGVLGEDAFYFSQNEDLLSLFSRPELGIDSISDQCREKNFQKIVQEYNWDKITRMHEQLFTSLLKL